ncbi:MAG: 23S rRNA (pseudouridine(1915)-N(3))-methyltransferase RlmH [Chitinophagales bacterium]|nr:23S rRNA (pseudouridine(1915)-N(3))-methyltransferase RlmH [Chitinophagales bacterium]
MRYELWAIGKTNEKYLEEGCKEYLKRISRFGAFEFIIWNDVRIGTETPAEMVKQKEATSFLSKLSKDDYVVLLDEKGNSMSSRSFAEYLEDFEWIGKKKVIFIIGGAFGFDKSLYQRANDKLSLSKMTMSHQLIRLVFLEQFYRAMTILNNHPYHND